MIELSKFQLSDYEQVVNMYYEFTKEVYPNRKIGERYFFYKVVQKWINDGADIVIATEGVIPIGFSVCYKDEFGGLTESIYQCDIAYVKPHKRKSRAAYLLFNNGYEYAKQLGLKVSTSGRTSSKVDKMMMKHFNLTQTFTTLEGV
jgi:hypothetical protein